MFTFTQEDENKIEKIVEKYPVKQSALLPLLTLVQRREGYIAPKQCRRSVKSLIYPQAMFSP